MNKVINEQHINFLKKIGAATTKNHVVIPGGKHATASFTKYKLFPQPEKTRIIAKTIAAQFAKDRIQAVVGAANGGSILAVLVAEQLSKQLRRSIPSFYTELDSNGGLVLKDAANRLALRHRRVLMVDDTVRDGATMRQVRTYLTKLRAEVVGLGVICVRNEEAASNWDKTKFYSYAVFNDQQDSFLPANCPLCRAGIPMSKKFGTTTV
ncbi:hypothetical protein HY346_02845 [Candidatus Microgenomates bacterium]|nr:hypothetical protein [Candidatus Microgenomates bacterium]